MQWRKIDQAAAQLIALYNRAYAFRRTSEDEVARSQGDVARKVGNGVGHRPDHVAQITFLPDYAIDLKSERTLRRVPDFAGWRQCGNGGALVKGLAHFPGVSLRLKTRLNITAGQIKPQTIAPDMIKCVRRIHSGATLANGDHHFHFVMQILGARRIGDSCGSGLCRV